MSIGIGTSSPNMGPRSALRNLGAETAETDEFNFNILVGLLRFIKPYTRQMLAALVLMLLTTGFTIAAPYLLKVAIDENIAKGDLQGLTTTTLLTVLTFTGLFLATYGQGYVLAWVGRRVLANMRSDMFEHLQRLSIGYHDTHIVGVTVSRVINDVAVINQLLSEGIITTIGDLLILVSIIVVMVSMSPRLALITFSIIPIMILATLVFTRFARVAYRETRTKVAAVVGDLAENLASMRVIQAFAQEKIVQEQFKKINDENRDAHIRAMRLSFVFLPTIEFLSILATVVVLVFGGIEVIQGATSIGVMVAFLSYVTRFFQPIQELSQMYTTMQSAIAGGEQVLKILNTKSEVQDKPGASIMPPITGRIAFEDVTFRYRPETPDVLHNVSFTIEPGKTVALVGHTGAGKSTIANLVMRFYEVSEGAVQVDGVDLREVTQRSLRQQISLIPQDPFLFSGTIAENIRFGLNGIPDEDVFEAARLVNAHEFISRKADGYDTVIMEGGVNISVGQRQLICMARALLPDPRILIMDEATSNIDTVTEDLIQKALKELLRGRTAVIIAHRLSTILDADKIFVLDQGRLVEQGRHEDLIARKGTYYNLYQKQFKTAEMS